MMHFGFESTKIDREFISDLPHDSEDVAITSAIIALGKALKLDVVAEGVETPEQRQFLKEKTCDFAQGFLFAKPMPPEEFVTWYKEKAVPKPQQ